MLLRVDGVHQTAAPFGYLRFHQGHEPPILLIHDVGKIVRRTHELGVGIAILVDRLDTHIVPVERMVGPAIHRREQRRHEPHVRTLAPEAAPLDLLTNRVLHAGIRSFQLSHATPINLNPRPRRQHVRRQVRHQLLEAEEYRTVEQEIGEQRRHDANLLDRTRRLTPLRSGATHVTVAVVDDSLEDSIPLDECLLAGLVIETERRHAVGAQPPHEVVQVARFPAEQCSGQGNQPITARGHRAEHLTLGRASTLQFVNLIEDSHIELAMPLHPAGREHDRLRLVRQTIPGQRPGVLPEFRAADAIITLRILDQILTRPLALAKPCVLNRDVIIIEDRLAAVGADRNRPTHPAHHLCRPTGLVIPIHHFVDFALTHFERCTPGRSELEEIPRADHPQRALRRPHHLGKLQQIGMLLNVNRLDVRDRVHNLTMPLATRPAASREMRRAYDQDAIVGAGLLTNHVGNHAAHQRLASPAFRHDENTLTVHAALLKHSGPGRLAEPLFIISFIKCACLPAFTPSLSVPPR